MRVADYIASVLSECDNAPQGEGNYTLYRSALKLGALVKRGLLPESDFERLLLDTDAARRRSTGEAKTTIASGLKRADSSFADWITESAAGCPVARPKKDRSESEQTVPDIEFATVDSQCRSIENKAAWQAIQYLEGYNIDYDVARRMMIGADANHLYFNYWQPGQDLPVAIKIRTLDRKGYWSVRGSRYRGRLYGEYALRLAGVYNYHVFLLETERDVLAVNSVFYRAGYHFWRRAVASPASVHLRGSTLTGGFDDKQLDKLSMPARGITCLMDRDRAGILAARRYRQQLPSLNLEMAPKNVKDFGDYLRLDYARASERLLAIAEKYDKEKEHEDTHPA